MPRAVPVGNGDGVGQRIVVEEEGCLTLGQPGTDCAAVETRNIGADRGRRDLVLACGEEKPRSIEGVVVAVHGLVGTRGLVVEEPECEQGIEVDALLTAGVGRRRRASIATGESKTISRTGI